MGSVAWSEEEARYFRALLSWDPNKAIDDGVRAPPPLYEKPSAGEFKVLVVGAKGCGKTSLLTRFCQGTFPRFPEHEHGCRHRVLVETQPYVLDILEFPPDRLPNPDPQSLVSLAQAVRMTDAAILVYDVWRRDSFALLQCLHDVIHHELSTTAITTTTRGFQNPRQPKDGARHQKQQQMRDYALTLVGTKCDSDQDGDGVNWCEPANPTAVSWAEGYQLARGFRIRSAFVEASARTGENVDGLFAQLGRELVRLRQLRHEQQAEAENLMAEKATGMAGSGKKAKYEHNSGGGFKSFRWKWWARPCFRV